MSNYVDVFLMKSILGRGAYREKSQQSVILGCIKKAYGDMMTGGQHYPITGKQEKCETIYTILDSKDYDFTRDLIQHVADVVFGEEKIYNAKGDYVVPFGLAQKVINMTFKYLYCFREFTGLKIDFEKCDCPIDRFVLEAMKDDFSFEAKCVWSKLDRGEYERIQGALEGQKFEVPEGLPPCSSRLLYDFHVW